VLKVSRARVGCGGWPRRREFKISQENNDDENKGGNFDDGGMPRRFVNDGAASVG
jgi:hypothetical protein